MNAFVRQIGCLLGALLVAGGCATTGGAGQGFDGRAKQADEKLPAAARFYDEAERKLVEDAQVHQAAARKAIEESNAEKARGEGAAAAERYARFADTFPASEWRITFRYEAARFFLFALQYDRAAEQADKLLAEPAASDVTRAMAAQLSAVAWRGVAVQRVKAGQIEPIKLATAEQRGGAALAPRAPPEPWKRFVDAVDAYLAVWEKHPEIAKRPAERSLALTPWSGALIAAEVAYSCDQMQDAKRRLQHVIDGWPAEVDVMEKAVPLLLQTLLVLKDEAGLASLKHLEEVLGEQGGKASDAKAKETYRKLGEEVVAVAQWRDFGAAKAMLDAGRSAEAAEAFERFAADNAAAADAATALSNAALGWDRAGLPEKAVAARAALLARYGDSKLAPVTALQQGQAASKREDHEEAARQYEGFLGRWPDAPNRCLAMQNLGYELDVLGKKVESAERYLVFGKDATCRKERPNDVAKGLCRSVKLFLDAKMKPRAREAFEALARLEGVNDPGAKAMIDDVRRQAKEVAR